MKTFKENYSLVSTKSGLKAVPKTVGGFAETRTADGTTYRPEEKYFFFAKDEGTVRQTVGLRRISEDSLGSFGLTVCKVSQLRINLTDALSDGQKFFKSEIENLQEKIEVFELEKGRE